jgi:hypothetical protein
MVKEYATDVKSLIAALQKLKPEQRVIGEACRALIVVSEQQSGEVLIAQGHQRDMGCVSAVN